MYNKLSLLYPPPQPWMRAKSLPVPKGRIAIGGQRVKFILSNTPIIQLTVPSPPQTNTCSLLKAENDFKIFSGEQLAKSTT